MIRNRIAYGQSIVFASQPPSNSDNSSNLTGLKRVQSFGVDWEFNRKRFTQIGSPDFTEDVHLRNAQIRINTSYFYSNGTNEAVLGIDVDGAKRGALHYLSKEFQDRNLYLIAASGENSAFYDTDFTNGYDIMSFGNCFMDSYSLSASAGGPVTINTSFSAYNMKVDVYDNSNGKGIPAIDTSIGEPTLDGHVFKITEDNIANTSNLDSLIEPAITSNYIELNLPEINIPGQQLNGSRNSPVNSMTLSFDIRRRDGYGFGSLYPYGRKTILPILGNLSFSSNTTEYETGILHEMISSGENIFDFTFNFKGCSGMTGLQVDIQGAKLDRESQNMGIGGNMQTNLNFSFSISDQSGLKISTPPLVLNHPDDNITGQDLLVVATGKTPITYQWIKDDSVIGGATNSTYTPSSAGDYYVIMTNQLGTGRSRVATVSN